MILVERESLGTKSQHISPAWVDKDGNSYLTSSDKPFPIIDVNHLRLHEGRSYYAFKQYTYSAGLPAGSSIDIALAFPSGVTPHSVFGYGGSGEAEFYVYESPTTSGGTSLAIHRHNRNLLTTSSGVAVLDPTVSNVGTQIFGEFVPANKQGGGGQNYTHEFVLKPLTTYLFRLTNVNAQPHAANLMIEWYE